MQKKWSCDDEFYDHVMRESLPSGKLLHSLFASLLSFALSSNIQSKICYRGEFKRCKIHHMDKICLELGTFEEFATAVLQTVVICTKRCLSSGNHFFESAAETNGVWNGLKKKPFQQTSGINSKQGKLNTDRSNSKCKRPERKCQVIIAC